VLPQQGRSPGSVANVPISTPQLKQNCLRGLPIKPPELNQYQFSARFRAVKSEPAMEYLILQREGETLTLVSEPEADDELVFVVILPDPLPMAA
jgi:hypothetical protein